MDVTVPSTAEDTMNLSLDPDTEKFIDEQVTAGHYPSAEAVIRAAIAEMQAYDEIDDATADAINQAEAEADRGEGMSVDEFRAKLAKRFPGV
jgi:putative addiction module CopG family antidote